MSLALYEPLSESRCQHLSIAVYKNRIVSIAKNNKKTSPINLLNPKFDRDGQNISGIKGSCSELNALKKIKRMTNIPFEKITLYVTRVNRNKQISMSRPCFSCCSLLDFEGIKDVFYTNNLGEFEKL